MKRKISPEIKEQARREVERGDDPHFVALRHGVSVFAIYGWRRKQKAGVCK